MTRTKECTKCGVIKLLSEFSKHRLSPDGHAYQCKECNAKRAKVWRASPEGIYHNIQGRANYLHKHSPKRFKPVLITKDEFVKWYGEQPKYCVYCDISEEDVKIWNDHLNSYVKKLTIECKDNLVGYTLDNMALACERCNFIKGNMFSYEIMQEIGQKYVKPLWGSLKSRARIVASRESGMTTIAPQVPKTHKYYDEFENLTKHACCIHRKVKYDALS